MNLLLTIKQQDVDSGSPQTDNTNYRRREAARAVLLDKSGSVYLLNVTKHGYHKLPGGGIDEGEEIHKALKRELLEEVGCEAKVIAELGIINETRDFEKLNQISYCFLAQQTGEQGSAQLEESEIAEGMQEVKVKNIDQAIALLQSNNPDNLEGQFIKKRDLAILNKAKEVLNETL